jgi:hypothetical protein
MDSITEINALLKMIETKAITTERDKIASPRNVQKNDLQNVLLVMKRDTRKENALKNLLKVKTSKCTKSPKRLKWKRKSNLKSLQRSKRE